MDAERRIELDGRFLKIWQEDSFDEQIIAVIPLTEEEFEQLSVETKEKRKGGLGKLFHFWQLFVKKTERKSVPEGLLLKVFDAGQERGKQGNTKLLPARF